MNIDRYYTLGRSSLRVSRLALGTMTFGTIDGRRRRQLDREIQGMIHGGTPVGDKPAGYRPEVAIEGTGAGVE